ncbi:hypothetical protein MARINOS108_11108 [Marinoscillum sp. 108]|nr:hypothetical protein MARINOS108_11108 [Marinoscillum sp. 108]
MKSLEHLEESLLKVKKKVKKEQKVAKKLLKHLLKDNPNFHCNKRILPRAIRVGFFILAHL